ncbi:MAG: glycosyltransferase [Patescibacteria group bacterium]
MKAVSIVIPNFNGKMLFEKHLSNVVKASENKKNRISEIIIVDDKSTDDSLGFLKKNFPQVKLVRHTKNRGFSSTVNTGVRTAKSELVCLLNTDVSPAVNFLEDSLIHFDDGKVFGVSFNEKGAGFTKGKFQDGFIVFDGRNEKKTTSETFWVSGGSGIFSRSIWMKLNGLDEKLLSPFYWEDIDICYRAWKRGYKLLWESKSVVDHIHEATMSTLSQSYVTTIRQRNQLLVVWKNITSQRLFRKHIQGLFSRIFKHPGYIRIVVLGLLKLKVVLKARKKEKKESSVSDEAIFARFAK